MAAGHSPLGREERASFDAPLIDPPADMPSEILVRLRAATHAIHRQLHHHPLLRPLERGTASQFEYVAALRCFYGFYAPLERGLLGSSLAEDYRRYASPSVNWLIEDLLYYRQSLDAVPLCGIRPDAWSMTELLGLLYVKEGSLLGGRVILRNLSATLPTEANSFRFFSGLGEDTGQHWRHLIDRLEALGKGLDSTAVCVSAGTVFEQFKIWADHCSVMPATLTAPPAIETVSARTC